MLNRINKVGQRFREVEGKSFNKITEEKLNQQELIHELEQSVKEVAADPKGTKLQQQKLESTLIRLKRHEKLVK